MKWILALSVIAGTTLFLAVHAPPRAAAGETVPCGEPQPAASRLPEVHGEAVLIFVPGVSSDMARSYVELLGCEVLREFAELTASSGKVHLHVLSRNTDTEALLRRFGEDAFVESATPNIAFRAR